MELTKYNKYKDSGARWLGDIPDNWEIIRNKNIFYEVSNYSTTGDEMLLTVSHITGVTPRSEKNVNMFLAETMQGYKLTEPDDLLINTMWAWMGALGTNSYHGICSPAYNVYRKYKSIPYDRRYFDYLFRTSNFVIEMTRYSKGIVSSRLRLYPSEFFQIMTPLPTYIEQKKISEYLDINKSIINLRISLLNKKKIKYVKLKESLISEIVTKGLNKAVEKKDSEIEWPGMIPKHWEVRRLKDDYTLSTGNSLADKENYSETKDAIPYIATKDINISTLSVDYDNGIYIPLWDKSFKVAKAYSSLVCLEGGSAGKKIAFIDRDVCYVNKLCSLRKKKQSSSDKFIYYFLQSNLFKNQFKSILNGLIGGVSMSLMGNFLITTPPNDEQKLIVDYLNEKTSQIDSIIMSIELQIKTLEELTKTLTNNLVTGKLKVT